MFTVILYHNRKELSSGKTVYGRIKTMLINYGSVIFNDVTGDVDYIEEKDKPEEEYDPWEALERENRGADDAENFD